MFRLINLDTGEYLANARSAFSFDDGRKAARAARLATRKVGAKVQPRKVDDTGDDNWREREYNRLLTGEYRPLHDSIAYWATTLYPEWCAHCAKKNPMLIAYTKDEAKGRADKQSLMSIDAFVRLLGQHPDAQLDDDTIARLIARHTDYAKQFAQSYKLATTPEQIVEVYTDYDQHSHSVANSCMRYDESHWSRVGNKRYHPVSVYGAGDLAVAYLTNDNGQTVARCLVWPDKKIYSRMYAENDALHTMLKADGYKRSGYYDYGSTSLRGARLLRVENSDGQLVCPYLDEVGTVDDMGDYLVIGGDINAQRTDGVTEDVDSSCCEHCGERVDEDELRAVYTNAGRTSSEAWCEHCVESRSFYCYGTEEHYADDVDMVEVDGDMYTLRYVQQHANQCERTDDYTFNSLTTVIVDSDGNTQQWCDDACNDYGYEWDGEWYSEDIDAIEVVTERYVAAKYDRYFGNRTASDGTNYRVGMKTINVWFYDRVQRVPAFLIDSGEVDVAVNDGVTYLRGYKDNYPVARERMDFDIMDMECIDDAA